MKIVILMVTVLVLQGTGALFRRTSTSGSSTSGGTRVSTGGTSTRTGTGSGNAITRPNLPDSTSRGTRPVIPGSTSTGGSTRPKLPGSGTSGTTGTNTGKTTTTKKLMGDDVKTRLPADEPKVPTKSSPPKPDLPGAEKSRMNKALDILKQYKGIIIEGAISVVAESAASMAFDAIVGSWRSSNEEGAAIEETPSGGTEPAEITNQCTEEEGAAYVLEATKELLGAGQDPESPEGKQYIQDYVAYICAVNTARR